jgi:hypothetical protein
MMSRYRAKRDMSSKALERVQSKQDKLDELQKLRLTKKRSG